MKSKISDSYICSFAKSVSSVFRESKIYSFLKASYKALSGGFNNSRIVSAFCQEKCGQTKNLSFISKILYFPFFIISLFANDTTQKLYMWFRNTFLFRILHSFVVNLTTLSSRFLGCILFFASGISLIGGKIPGVAAAVLLTVSALLMLFDFSFSKAFSVSIVNKLFAAFFDTDISFDNFEAEADDRRFKMAAASLFGVVSGIIWALSSPLYAAGIMGAVLVFFRPEFGIGLLVFAMPLIPTMACMALALWLFLALAVKKCVNKDKSWKFTGMEAAVILFAIVYIICSLTSVAKISSIKICALYIALMSVYFTIRNGIVTKANANRVIISFILSGTLVAAYGIIQYIFKIGMESQVWLDEQMFSDIKMRAFSTLENPNVLGEYLLLVIPVAIAYFWSSKKPLVKAGYLGASAVLLLCMILTMSRGCWVSLLIAAAVYITFVNGRYWILAVVAMFILPFVLPASVINRFTSIGDLSDSSSSYRLYIWLGTLNMLRDYWFVGTGPGLEAFNFVYPKYAYSAIIAPHSHSVFLQICAETGFAGISAFFLIIWMYIRNVAKCTRKLAQNSKTRILLIAFAAGIIAFLTEGVFDYLFYNNRVFMTFWAVLGMTIALKDTAKEELND